MSDNDVFIGAEAAEGAGEGVDPRGAEDRPQTPPPSMTPESGYDPDAPKIHRSPPKEEVYPDWKPGDPHPATVSESEDSE